MIRLRSSPLSTPGAITLRLFLNAHYKSSLPMQLKVVWDQLLQADPKGPALIFCTALLFEQHYSAHPRIRGTLTACTLAESPIAISLHRRLQPLRYLHDCFDCFRPERFSRVGLSPTGKAPPLHGARQKRTLTNHIPPAKIRLKADLHLELVL
jgi:hypothetical protein